MKNYEGAQQQMKEILDAETLPEAEAKCRVAQVYATLAVVDALRQATLALELIAERVERR